MGAAAANSPCGTMVVLARISPRQIAALHPPARELVPQPVHACRVQCTYGWHRSLYVWLACYLWLHLLCLYYLLWLHLLWRCSFSSSSASRYLRITPQVQQLLEITLPSYHPSGAAAARHHARARGAR